MSSEDKLCVVVVDDEPISRRALRGFLEDAGIEVAAEAADGEAGLRAVLDVAPDVALVDLGLPVIPGIQVTERISALAPATRVLVVTGSSESVDVIDALRAGASGYLLKEAGAEEIVAATLAVARGEPVFSAAVASQLIEVVRHRPPSQDGLIQDGGRPDEIQLTQRELEILKLIAAGKDNAEIAKLLIVSRHTVKNHVANILAKLQLENRIQAAVHAVRTGLA